MNNKSLTIQQYENEVKKCEEIFFKKNKDYGTAWQILRPKSITDQILIKALRIRSIEEKQENKVGESIENEFIGIYNYCIIGLIQFENYPESPEIELQKLQEMYHLHSLKTKDLMLIKNHDYGEAWREMRTSSFTDLILMKINRTKQIEDNQGKTLISEGIDANYQDMMNYSIFALINLNSK